MKEMKSMNQRKKLEMILGMLVLIGICLALVRGERLADAMSESVSGNIVVLDAGHGGSDPGKVGVNQALEKDINLSIAKMVKKELEKNDITVIMTREKDEGLYDKGAQNKKVQDLKRRLAIMNDSGAQIAVSIHQNSFHEENCSGAQVFYHEQSVEGKKLAELMQGKFKQEIDTENNRVAKGNTSYYLLKETTLPCIIVECGFLSNWKESALLIEEDYQKKLAQTITGGILEYLNKNKKTDGK